LKRNMTNELEIQIHLIEHSGQGSGSESVSKHYLKELEHRIMTAIETFASRQNAFNDRIDSAVTGLQGDVTALTTKIAELQASAGAITPEDQALLDQIESRSQIIADKLEALDALNANVPTPPVA
jgi:hypothetical protein